jgi:hypothetical protein
MDTANNYSPYFKADEEVYKDVGMDVFAPYDRAMVDAANYLYPEAYTAFVSYQKNIAYILSKIGTSDRYNKLIKYPIVAVQRVSADYDINRAGRGPGRYPHRRMRYKENKTVVEMWRRMAPISLSYQYDLLENKNLTKVNEMVFRLMSELDNSDYTYLNVDLGDVYGTIRVFWSFGGAINNSQLPSDVPSHEEAGEDRIFRYSIASTIEGWMPRGYTYTGTFRSFELDEGILP